MFLNDIAITLWVKIADYLLRYSHKSRTLYYSLH